MLQIDEGETVSDAEKAFDSTSKGVLIQKAREFLAGALANAALNREKRKEGLVSIDEFRSRC